MTRASPGLGAVASPAVGDVRIQRHVLEIETGRLAMMAAKVGRRLRMYYNQVVARELRNTVDGVLLDPETGKEALPWIPGEDFRKDFEAYGREIRGLLAEQRQRAAMVPGKGGLALTDAEFKAELRTLALEHLRSMPEPELRALLAERTTTTTEKP